MFSHPLKHQRMSFWISGWKLEVRTYSQFGVWKVQNWEQKWNTKIPSVGVLPWKTHMLSLLLIPTCEISTWFQACLVTATQNEPTSNTPGCHNLKHDTRTEAHVMPLCLEECARHIFPTLRKDGPKLIFNPGGAFDWLHMPTVQQRGSLFKKTILGMDSL